MSTSVITIFTDASEIGWGITDEHNPSEDQWAEHERMHINVLGTYSCLCRNSHVLP